MLTAEPEAISTAGPTIEDGTRVAVLVDFDNAFPRPIQTSEQMASGMNRILRCALGLYQAAGFIDVRIYGGWLDEGVMTKRASEIHTAIGGMSPIFPMAHPSQEGLLRGEITLATRLVSAPTVEWRHTLRRRSGLPRITLADQPYPARCFHQGADCPVKLLQKFARRGTKQCHLDGCSVTNHEAFRVPEQKMVDVMLSCDAIYLASVGWYVAVLSSDMDVLPAVASIATTNPGWVSIVRSVGDSSAVYDGDLALLGVAFADWET